jgi:thioredoxin reductase
MAAVCSIALTAMVGSCAINPLQFTVVQTTVQVWPLNLLVGVKTWFSVLTDRWKCRPPIANNLRSSTSPYARRIARLEGTDGQLERIVFENGEALSRRAMFFNTGQDQRCDLAEKLGCEFTERGAVRTGEYETTDVPGLYVAGDASRAVQLAIVAAAEGAEAAFAINKSLIKENLDQLK